MLTFSVAIDGPGSAGKSTAARLAAHELGFVYIDTGAMYRAVALFCMDNYIPFERDALCRRLGDIDIGMEDEQRVFLNGNDVSKALRTQAVEEGSSKVAVFHEVREKLVDLQRKLARNTDVIMDGRDIGTVVLPFADVKIYLDASVEHRARRRQAELLARGVVVELERMRNEIIERDIRDSTRECSPLRRARDAVLLDTSDMSLEQVKDWILDIVAQKRGMRNAF